METYPHEALGATNSEHKIIKWLPELWITAMGGKCALARGSAGYQSMKACAIDPEFQSRFHKAEFWQGRAEEGEVVTAAVMVMVVDDEGFL